jgi:3-oxoacyl-[acyl-carrier protein] reductase
MNLRPHAIGHEMLCLRIDDRGAVDDGMALKLNGARRLTIEGLGRFEGLEWIGRVHVRKRRLCPKPGYAAVAAINAAINAVAKAFAGEGIKDGVQVNSVSPGAVMTGRRQSFFEKWAPAHNLTVEEAIKQFPEQAGISRLGKPEEIADLMSYLVPPAAKWMTGASIRMDGGEIKGI